MSLDAALPMSLLSLVSQHTGARKLGTLAAQDAEVKSGFGAVLAGLDGNAEQVNDSPIDADQRRKSSEADATLLVTSPAVLNTLEVKGADALLEATTADRFANAKVSEGVGPLMRGDRAGQEVDQEGLIASGTTTQALSLVAAPIDGGGVPRDSFAAGMAGGELISRLDTAVTSEVLTPNSQVDIALSAVLESAKLGGRNAAAESVAVVVKKPVNSLARSLSQPKQELVSSKQLSGDVADQVVGVALRADDMSARTRLSQEFRLLSQQASFSRGAVDGSLLGLETEFPRFSKLSKDVGAPSIELKGDGGSSTYFEESIDGPTVDHMDDSLMGATTESETRGDYWIPQELSNAKLRLGDSTEGVVEVSISLQGSQAQVTFQTDETTTRHALQDSGSELKEMLRRDGIELSDVWVGTSGFGGGNGDRRGSGSESFRPGSQSLQTSNPEAPSSVESVGDTSRVDLYV